MNEKKQVDTRVWTWKRDNIEKFLTELRTEPLVVVVWCLPLSSGFESSVESKGSGTLGGVVVTLEVRRLTLVSPDTVSTPIPGKKHVNSWSQRVIGQERRWRPKSGLQGHFFLVYYGRYWGMEQKSGVFSKSCPITVITHPRVCTVNRKKLEKITITKLIKRWL